MSRSAKKRTAASNNPPVEVTSQLTTEVESVDNTVATHTQQTRKRKSYPAELAGFPLPNKKVNIKESPFKIYKKSYVRKPQPEQDLSTLFYICTFSIALHMYVIFNHRIIPQFFFYCS